MEDVLNRKNEGFKWLDYFTEHGNIEKLTREVAVSLIREVKVMDKTHIEIVFDYDDQYRECMEVIAGMENEDNLGNSGVSADGNLTGTSQQDSRYIRKENMEKGAV